MNILNAFVCDKQGFLFTFKNVGLQAYLTNIYIGNNFV